VNNKAAGSRPKAPDVSAVLASRSSTLDEEIKDLLALARWWPAALSGAKHLAPSQEKATQ
jgi:hypothetical protein